MAGKKALRGGKDTVDLVLGAGGFIGGSIARRLASRGRKVRCLVRRQAAAKPLEEAGFEVFLGDITEPRTLGRAFEGAEHVIHAAGLATERGKYTYESVNWLGTRNVAAAVKAAGAELLVYISATGCRSESRNPYIRSLRLGEEEIGQASVPYVILRCNAVLGPSSGWAESVRRSVIGGFAFWVGSGRNLVQPIYVEDLARMVDGVVDRKNEFKGKTFEVCGPERISVNALLDLAYGVMGVKARRVNLPRHVALPARLFKPSVYWLLKFLDEDSVCSGDAQSLAASLGVKLTPVAEAVSRTFSQAGWRDMAGEKMSDEPVRAVSGSQNPSVSRAREKAFSGAAMT